jgi:hypothetical protein
MPETNRNLPRSRFTPKPTAGLRLEERDEQLLCDLYQHRFMTRGQLETLFFTSTVRCNARLRQLFDYGFVKRYYLPAAPYGAQAIYSVGKNAVPIVASCLEADTDEVTRQYRGTRTPSFIEHTLAVVDVWLAFREACAKTVTVEMERWMPEMLCRHEYQIREKGTKHWRKEVFKPDAFVRLAVDGHFLNFFIEMDLGHTSSRQFLGKLHTHQRYLESGLFHQLYRDDDFKTLIITTGQRRLKNLASLTSGQNSQLFWFTSQARFKMEGPLGRVWAHKEGETHMALCQQGLC